LKIARLQAGYFLSEESAAGFAAAGAAVGAGALALFSELPALLPSELLALFSPELPAFLLSELTDVAASLLSLEDEGFAFP
jgi:hypothetical protein